MGSQECQKIIAWTPQSWLTKLVCHCLGLQLFLCNYICIRKMSDWPISTRLKGVQEPGWGPLGGNRGGLGRGQEGLGSCWWLSRSMQSPTMGWSPLGAPELSCGPQLFWGCCIPRSSWVWEWRVPWLEGISSILPPPPHPTLPPTPGGPGLQRSRDCQPVSMSPARALRVVSELVPPLGAGERLCVSWALHGPRFYARPAFHLQDNEKKMDPAPEAPRSPGEVSRHDVQKGGKRKRAGDATPEPPREESPGGGQPPVTSRRRPERRSAREPAWRDCRTFAQAPGRGGHGTAPSAGSLQRLLWGRESPWSGGEEGQRAAGLVTGASRFPL